MAFNDFPQIMKDYFFHYLMYYLLYENGLYDNRFNVSLQRYGDCIVLEVLDDYILSRIEQLRIHYSNDRSIERITRTIRIVDYKVAIVRFEIIFKPLGLSVFV